MDSKALIPNDTKTSNLPYDCVHTSFERILDGDFTFDGARKNHFEIKCSDLVNFAKINLSEILSDVKFVIDLDDSSENKLVVHTDRVDDSKLEEVSTTLSNVLPANIELVQYNHNIEVSWHDYFKYQDCVNISDLKKVNSDYVNDVTSSGLWCYSLPKFNQANLGFGNGVFKYSKARRIHLDLPAITDCWCITMNANELEEIRFNFSKTPTLENLCPSTPKLKSVEIIAPKATTIKDMCGNVWYPSGAVQHVRLYTPLVSYGERAFYMCELDVASVLNIVEMIPSWDSDPDSHPLDFGIHIDHKQDPDVLAALARAEEKGWKISVRWNGKPTAATASTFGLRGQLIYAKEGELERPDGTTEKYLDWAHYVTDETGYETFRSLESAYEYFGLEMPSIGD